MTPESTTETRFAFEGFVPLWAIVCLGIGWLGLAWWLARRDAAVAERRKAVRILFMLRVVAVLILLWMLAGPTWVTTLRNFRTKTIAVLVDTSASMGLVDIPDGSGNVVRWAAARNEGRQSRLLHDIDDAVGRLRAQERQLERFARLSDAEPDLASARGLLSRAPDQLKAGVADLLHGAEALPSSAVGSKDQLKEAADVINGDLIGILTSKAAEFSRGRTLAAIERDRWLPDLLAQLSGAVGSLERVAAQISQSAEESESRSPDGRAPLETGRSRLDTVEAFLSSAENGWLKDLRGKVAVRRYEFGEKVVPLGSAPWVTSDSAGGKSKPLSPSTRLGVALQQVALDRASDPVAAAILLTDGGQNAGRDPREVAGSLAGTPLHLVPIGNTRMQRDVILHHTHAPKAVFQNDQVVVDAMVTAYDCAKETLQVELLDQDTVVERQSLNVPAEVFDSRVQLRWKAAKLGKHSLRLRVVPVGDERSQENNGARTDVLVMEDKIRVLVADNFPRWETRYLLNLFRRDDRVQFDQVLFEPQRSSGAGVRSSLPTSPAEWAKYRIVILGDLLPAQLSPDQQRSLREYVTETGGNLILVAGDDAMPAAYVQQPLGALLPVQAGDRPLVANAPAYLHLADEGTMALATQIAETIPASERAWREMSEHLPIYGLSEFSKPRVTAHSLIWASPNRTGFTPGDAGTRSFLAWHYVGAGRVVYLAAPVTYGLRYRQGDAFHHRFWGQLLRWAIARDLAEGSQTVRLGTDKSRYEEGESVQLSVHLRQLDGKPVAAAALEVTASQDGKVVQAVNLREDLSQPGAYLGTLEQLTVGPVKLQVTGERVKALLASENVRQPVETTVAIDPSDQLELRHPLCNLPLLRELADASGGMIVPPTGLEGALRQLDLEPQVLETTSKTPLWNRWDLFWIFIACLGFEWAGRKWAGLS